MQKKKPSFFSLLGISLLLAGLFSAAAIFAADEIFALTAAPSAETLVLPEGADEKTVARLLKEKNFVRSALLFRLYARVRSFGTSYAAGEVTLDHAMSYDELRAALSPKKRARTELRITIPEGLTTDEIVDLFVSRGVGTREGFADAIENGGSFGYDFVEAIPADARRTYRLDGYLFPDTYFVYADATEQEVIQKLLDNFNRKMDESLRRSANAAGLTVDEAVCLAAMIEREAYASEDMAGISSVFHNRLHSARFPHLESDATVRYAKALAGLSGAPTAEEVHTLESPYNTYLCRGLPPSAICSPGLDALRAAVSPAETPYFYFVSAKDKTMIFSKTYEEHRRAVASCASDS